MNDAPEPSDFRPWEQPGCVRRDCDPHRGELLRFLGKASAAFGAVSMFTLIPSCVGLPFGVAVVALARHDLRRMDRGLMDPQGREMAETAEAYALGGAVMSLLGLAVLSLPLLVGLWR
jgi:hypothetical protein